MCPALCSSVWGFFFGWTQFCQHAVAVLALLGYPHTRDINTTRHMRQQLHMIPGVRDHNITRRRHNTSQTTTQQDHNIFARVPSHQLLSVSSRVSTLHISYGSRSAFGSRSRSTRGVLVFYLVDGCLILGWARRLGAIRPGHNPLASSDWSFAYDCGVSPRPRQLSLDCSFLGFFVVHGRESLQRECLHGRD